MIYIEPISMSAAMNAGSLHRARQFFSLVYILAIYKSTIRPFIEYGCHIWSGACTIDLAILGQIRR